MDAPKQYRHKETGMVIEAVQYTLDNAISRIAKFILNIDVDAQVGVANERILDVVRPVLSKWYPHKGVATIEVIEPGTGFNYFVELEDWVGKRNNGRLLFIKPSAFEELYEEVVPEPVRTEYDDLSDLIYNVFPWEGETYQAVAEKTAAEIIRAGWSKKEKT